MRSAALVVVAMGAVLWTAPVWAEGERRPAAELFREGEELDYTLTWLKVAGGTARMTIALVAGQPQFRMSSLGESNAFFNLIFRVRDEIESVVDAESFSTLHYRKRLNERGRVRDDLTVVDPSRHTAVRSQSRTDRSGETATSTSEDIQLPSQVFDPLSLIYHLRTLELTPGRVHRFAVIADGKLYLLQADVIEGATIVTDAGTFKTVLVEPRMQSGGIFRDERNKLMIWYSEDESHVPVRIRSEFKAGSITATLRAINPPERVAGPPKESGRPQPR